MPKSVNGVPETGSNGNYNNYKYAPQYYFYTEARSGMHALSPSTKYIEIYLVGGGGGGGQCVIDKKLLDKKTLYPGTGGGGGATVFYTCTEIPKFISYTVGEGGAPGSDGGNTVVAGIPGTGKGLIALGGQKGNEFTKLETWIAGQGGQKHQLPSYADGLITYPGGEGPEPVINGYKCRGGSTYFGQGTTYGSSKNGAGGSGGLSENTKEISGSPGSPGLIIIIEY